MVNRVAVVTGGGRGIGKSIALKLAETGVDVAIVDRNIADGEKTASEIEKLGRRALAFKADVTVKLEVDSVIKKVIEQWGKIDILVNNVGWVKVQPFLEESPDKWDKVIDINLKSTIICSRVVLDYMIPRKQGKIVNISSDDGRMGSMNVGQEVVYAAAKAGVINFTKSLARLVGKYGITVNSVAPGVTETPLLREGMEHIPGFSRFVEENLECTPLGRLAKPEDVAEAVVFLSSSAADHITGQVLSVNGGFAMLD